MENNNKKCKICGVEVSSSKDTCPLCGAETVGECKNPTTFPKVKNHFEISKIDLVGKILNYSAFVIALASIIVNILTFKAYSLRWSIIVVIGLLYLLVLVKKTILSKMNLAKSIFFQYILISAASFVVDYLFSFHGWSLNYVIPLLSLGVAIAITVIVFVKFMHLRDYIHYTFTILLVGVLQLLLLLIPTVTVYWTYIASSAYSFVIFVALIIFSDKKGVLELKKRLHL